MYRSIVRKFQKMGTCIRAETATKSVSKTEGVGKQAVETGMSMYK